MIDKIKDLERDYMRSITKVTQSEYFLRDLKLLEKYIKDNYILLRQYTSSENKIKIGVES